MNKNIILLIITLCLYSAKIFAVEVYESKFSKNKVCVMLSSNEVSKASMSKDSSKVIGSEVARKVILLAGIPNSVSGKIALLPVWLTLKAKYSSDIYKCSRQVNNGNSLTLKYAVNIKGVQAVWKSSEVIEAIQHASNPIQISSWLKWSLNNLVNAALSNH